MAGDTETGVAIMRMDQGLDTGPSALPSASHLARVIAGELHDAGQPWRGAHGRGAGDWRAARSTAGRNKKRASPMPRRSSRPRRASTGPGRRRGAQPHPGAFALSRRLVRARAQWQARAVRALRSMLVEGAGTAGTVLDDHLTITCGKGSVRLLPVQHPKEADGGCRLPTRAQLPVGSSPLSAAPPS